MLGVDLAPLTEKIGELSDSLDSKMLEFTESMPEFAGVVSRGAVEIKELASEPVETFFGSPDTGDIEPSELDEEAKLTEKLREFAKNPRNYSILNEVINKTYLPPEAVDQLIENVEELKLAIQHGSLHINGLHRHVVTRSSDVLPDSVMWLCEHHKSMLEKFNSCEISEKQLLDHLDAATAPTQSSTATASPVAAPPLPTATALPPYRADPTAASSAPSTATVRGHSDATRLFFNVPCSAALLIV